MTSTADVRVDYEDECEGEHQRRIGEAQIMYALALSAGMLGQSAWPKVVSTIGRLETLDPDELVGPHPNPHARRSMRYLATLIHYSVTDDHLADVILYIVSNARITIDMVEDVLSGSRGRETPVAVLRVIADELRAGTPQRTIVEQVAGAGSSVVESVSDWLAAREAYETRLGSAALRAIAAGKTVKEFMAEEHIGRRLALRLMSEARETYQDVVASGAVQDSQ